VHDTSHFSNNCLQTDYFTYNSLYHKSSGSEVYRDRDTNEYLPTNFILELAEYALTYNYFRFDDDLYVEYFFKSGRVA
jgi:hypothetical protein